MVFEGDTPIMNSNAGQDKNFSIIEIFGMCIYFIILVTGVIGNGLVIFVTGYKMKTTVNSIWFLNLAITGFISILFMICDTAVVFKKMLWHLDDVMYKCVVFVTVLNMFASVFFLTVISLDRCLCTWVVVWAQNKRTLVKARIICMFVWLLSICCTIPYVIVLYVLKPKDECEDFKRYIDSCMSLYTYMFMVGFLIPFLISVSSYIAIGVRVKHLKRKKQRRPVLVIIAVILGFFICWFPYHVLQLCYVSAVKNNWSKSVVMKLYTAQRFVICLVYLNSCLNPILYVFMCDEYKTKLKRSLLQVLEGAFTEDHQSEPHFLYVFMCDEYKTKLKRSLLLVLKRAFTEENLSFTLNLKPLKVTSPPQA
ncbi:C3a anaphylatoxin chemotactic receptor-like [Triplophysa dalaica]|uniref:C3a anaphylatoxin chemotactic receptor-like n=1 Tax=Triplophysa dalaica TaxID=1582913 RepID=UPI0024E02646|nr:C3a anaphylatoxin chemotactic receptor-like [Triplophysa dalaica]